MTDNRAYIIKRFLSGIAAWIKSHVWQSAVISVVVAIVIAAAITLTVVPSPAGSFIPNEVNWRVVSGDVYITIEGETAGNSIVVRGQS